MHTPCQRDGWKAPRRYTRPPSHRPLAELARQVVHQLRAENPVLTAAAGIGQHIGHQRPCCASRRSIVSNPPLRGSMSMATSPDGLTATPIPAFGSAVHQRVMVARSLDALCTPFGTSRDRGCFVPGISGKPTSRAQCTVCIRQWRARLVDGASRSPSFRLTPFRFRVQRIADQHPVPRLI